MSTVASGERSELIDVPYGTLVTRVTFRRPSIIEQLLKVYTK